MAAAEVVFWVAFLGLWCGILARVALPYLRKLYQGKVKTWDNRYTVTMFAAAVMTFIVAILAIEQITMPSIPSAGLTGKFLFQVWSANFIVGYGIVSIINEVMALGKPPTTSPP